MTFSRETSGVPIEAQEWRAPTAKEVQENGEKLGRRIERAIESLQEARRQGLKEVNTGAVSAKIEGEVLPRIHDRVSEPNIEGDMDFRDDVAAAVRYFGSRMQAPIETEVLRWLKKMQVQFDTESEDAA